VGGITAAPRLGVATCELLDLLRIMRHGIGTTLTLAVEGGNPRLRQCW
jgi:hypothetical protein